MRICSLPILVAIALAMPGWVLADSNASGGQTLNSESVFIGAGPFDHAAPQGGAGNSTATASGWTGGFNATHLRMTGTATSVNPETWASELAFRVTDANPFGGTGFSVDWLNSNFTSQQTYTTISYDGAQELASTIDTSVFAFGLGIEFYDTFDDAGLDAQSTDVTITFEELVALEDTNGNWDLGSLNSGDQADSVGELALSGLYDLYTVNVTADGSLSIETSSDPNGYTGTDLDTEIALFDAAGNLLAENDDGGSGGGTFSGILDFDVTAGDYTIAVAGFNSTFADGFGVTPGDATGDYALSVAFVVPEPSTFTILGLGCLVMTGVRRRKIA